MLVKREVTSERAEMDEEDIEIQLLAEAGELMPISRLKNFGHKGLKTDLHLWKRAG
jgi:hypothetical protein